MFNLSEEHVICAMRKEDFVTFIKDGGFEPQSLRSEGFIHCCKPSQFSYVANKFFINDDYVLVISTQEKLGDKLKYEGEKKFPHLYRELRTQDIINLEFLKYKKGNYA